MRPTVLEVNNSYFIDNCNMIKGYCHGKEIMPVIKANGYGTHINYSKEVLKEFSIVAVAIPEEGIILRNNGYDGEIFILNQPSQEELKEIIEYSLTIGISEKDFIKKCVKDNISIPVHLEIETGMNRTGIKLEELNEILNLIKKSKLKVEGVYTHLSSADFDEAYTLEQIKKFEKALEIIEKEINTIKYIHVGASNGLLNYQLPYTNLVRPGLILYGYEPYKNAFHNLKLKPITTLKTKITFIKECKKGESIGYSRTFICPKDMIVGTIPIGYGDGYRRELSNKGYVFINNKKCQIIGNICMDSCMIDLTDINAKINDEVILWDNQNITVEEIAQLCNTINYELLSTISDRVPRIIK